MTYDLYLLPDGKAVVLERKSTDVNNHKDLSGTVLPSLALVFASLPEAVSIAPAAGATWKAVAVLDAITALM